jgi:hypothetical protein
VPSFDAPTDRGIVGYADPAFQTYVWSEVQQESSGNYNAVSSTGALGAYQIEPSNIPSWSTEALGHPITGAQFKASPDLQDEIAQYELLKNWNQHPNATTEDRVMQTAHSWNPLGGQQYEDQIWGWYAKTQFVKGGPASIFGGTAARKAATGQSDAPNWKSPNPTGTAYQLPTKGPIDWTKLKDGVLNSTQRASILTYLKANGFSKVSLDGGRTKVDVTSLTDKELSDFYINTQRPTDSTIPAPGLFGGAEGAIKGALSPFAWVESVFQTLASGKFWRRLGLGALGAALIGFAVFKMFGGSATGVAKKAAMVAAV